MKGDPMADLLIFLGDARETIDLDEVTGAIRKALGELRLTVHAVRFADDDEDAGEADPGRRPSWADRRPLVDPDAVALVTEEFQTLQFWIAYPEPVAELEAMEDRLRCAWGQGGTEQEALERARGTSGYHRRRALQAMQRQQDRT